MKKESKIFDLSTFTPYKQAILVLVVGTVFMIGNKLFQLSDVGDPNPEKIWVMAVTFCFFFSLMNCVFSLLTNTNAEKYWTQSMIIFLVTTAILAGLAHLISGMSITKTDSFQWIFIVVIICYFVFSTIVRMMKNIVDFAQREEWNQPKKRRDNRNPKGKR